MNKVNQIKKSITLMSTLCILSIISCTNNDSSAKNDLGIISNKIETYFFSDTAYDEQLISFYPKFNRDSLYYRPYNISIVYGKEYGVGNPGWRLEFSISHYDKYVTVYPSKGLLEIDDFKINYESVMKSEIGKEKISLFVYGTFDNIKNEQIVKMLAAAKIVKFTAIGHEKQNYTWSPKIIEDAKNSIKYFESLKQTRPIFN